MKKHLLKQLIKKVLLEAYENPSGDKYNPLKLFKTFKKDNWQRPIYVDRDNVKYVDITLGKEKEPQLYSVTDQGEPEYPIRNYKIQAKPNTGEYSHSPEMRVRSDEPQVSEALKPSGIATIEKWCNEIKDNRKVGVKLIDFILNKKVGLSSADLPDTSTFAGGLDSIEEALNSKDYQGAFNIAKDTATEMMEDEGFGMDENYDADDHERQQWQRGIDKYNKRNPSRFECPSCKKPNALSADQKRKGYQCDSCADSEEGTGYGFEESTEPSIGGSFKDQQTSCGGAEITQFERDPLTDPQLKKENEQEQVNSSVVQIETSGNTRSEVKRIADLLVTKEGWNIVGNIYKKDNTLGFGIGRSSYVFKIRLEKKI